MGLIIGSHVSFKKEEQLFGSVKESLSYGSNAFMIYTGAPQNTKRGELDNKLTKKAYTLMKENNINLKDIIVHAPYIINLAKKDNEFAISFLKKEIKRCQNLGIDKIVLHPGNYVDLTLEEGINNIARGLNEVLKNDLGVYICLETMAGKGTEIGRNFDELKEIIDKVEKKERILVCLDSCHMFDSGKNINEILEEFDKLIGIKKIGCIHINDSLNNKGDRKDRHANIGLGNIGFDKLIDFIYEESFKNIPKILETPYITIDEESKEKKYPPYKFEIEMIRNKKFNKNLKEEIRAYYK